MHVLLVGRTHEVIDSAAAQEHFQMPEVTLETATNAQEVMKSFESGKFDHVIIGAGIPLEERLKVVRAVFEASNTTTVHLKDGASGPDGFFPFVRDIISAL